MTRDLALGALGVLFLAVGALAELTVLLRFSAVAAGLICLVAAFGFPRMRGGPDA